MGSICSSLRTIERTDETNNFRDKIDKPTVIKRQRRHIKDIANCHLSPVTSYFNIDEDEGELDAGLEENLKLSCIYANFEAAESLERGMIPVKPFIVDKEKKKNRLSERKILNETFYILPSPPSTPVKSEMDETNSPKFLQNTVAGKHFNSSGSLCHKNLGSMSIKSTDRSCPLLYLGDNRDSLSNLIPDFDDIGKDKALDYHRRRFQEKTNAAYIATTIVPFVPIGNDNLERQNINTFSSKKRTSFHFSTGEYIPSLRSRTTHVTFVVVDDREYIQKLHALQELQITFAKKEGLITENSPAKEEESIDTNLEDATLPDFCLKTAYPHLNVFNGEILPKPASIMLSERVYAFNSSSTKRSSGLVEQFNSLTSCFSSNALTCIQNDVTNIATEDKDRLPIDIFVPQSKKYVKSDKEKENIFPLGSQQALDSDIPAGRPDTDATVNKSTLSNTTDNANFVKEHSDNTITGKMSSNTDMRRNPTIPLVTQNSDLRVHDSPIKPLTNFPQIDISTVKRTSKGYVNSSVSINIIEDSIQNINSNVAEQRLAAAVASAVKASVSMSSMSSICSNSNFKASLGDLPPIRSDLWDSGHSSFSVENQLVNRDNLLLSSISNLSISDSSYKIIVLNSSIESLKDVENISLSVQKGQCSSAVYHISIIPVAYLTVHVEMEMMRRAAEAKRLRISLRKLKQIRSAGGSIL